jgi:hypothetical protein
MLELEWYEGVRAGLSQFCDRCLSLNKITNINRDEFFTQRNQRGVYCEGCWNWIHLRKWKCSICQATGTLRNERLLDLNHCGELVIWQDM